VFKRDLETQVFDSLQDSSFFLTKLKPDILSGTVFSAIRRNYMDFYHKGGCLFRFQKEFTTHRKYASVVQSKSDYVSENDLQKNVRLIQDFAEGYEEIKQNCSLYSGEEAKGVSSIYHNYSFLEQNSDVVVLDIEISFKAIDENRKQDRIDLLLFNKKTQCLKFYEAKYFSNSELWSRANTRPRVIAQIHRYESQIDRNKSNILKQYENYVNLVNDLYQCNLPCPKDIDNNVVLLVFGFDSDQRQGRLRELLLKDNSLKEIKYYFIGNVSNLNILNMWNNVRCG
jgi:hypothetical protein